MSTRPGIDHPLILVRDIAAARAFYTRLGFTLTPVGQHPWGTSTSLAVLERSALELMGIYDDTRLDALEAGGFHFGRHMHEALAEREGIAVVALHSMDAEADAHAMMARGVPCQGLIGFRRRVKPPGGDWDDAVVTLAMLMDEALPRCSHFLAQQHRPDLLWVPAWMRHANGARAVAAVTYVAEDPSRLLHRLHAMFGRLAGTAAGWEAQTGQGVFRVLTPAEFRAMYQHTDLPQLTRGEPAAAAIDVAVDSLAQVQAVLEGAGVSICNTPGGPAVQDVAACGNTILRFVQSAAGRTRAAVNPPAAAPPLPGS